MVSSAPVLHDSSRERAQHRRETALPLQRQILVLGYRGEFVDAEDERPSINSVFLCGTSSRRLRVAIDDDCEGVRGRKVQRRLRRNIVFDGRLTGWSSLACRGMAIASDYLFVGEANNLSTVARVKTQPKFVEMKVIELPLYKICKRFPLAVSMR